MSNASEIAKRRKLKSAEIKVSPTSTDLIDDYFNDMLNADTSKSIEDYKKLLDDIDEQFKQESGLTKTDLMFLGLATALQIAKSLLFPYVSSKADYGEKFDTNDRFAHDDKNIKSAEKSAIDDFRDKKLNQGVQKDKWINILYQSVPYDSCNGSKELKIVDGEKGICGTNHRLYTLGHDPILGWIFGTANILTDTMTTTNFNTYRVARPLKMTSEMVSLQEMFAESYQIIKADKSNLYAALFKQAQHFKSDAYTKAGLPIPILTVFDEKFASNLYLNQYDNLCFKRDLKVIGTSFVLSEMIDIIISVIHGFFKEENVERDIYEVRTKKILLISKSIAVSSNIIQTAIYKNAAYFDIGGMVSLLHKIATDTKFMSAVRYEYLNEKTSQVYQDKIKEFDYLYSK